MSHAMSQESTGGVSPGALVVLCPGQGAQAVGMGSAWHAASGEARAVFERADRVLGSRLGVPLSELCFNGPAERLNRTDAAQPALFVAAVASWRGLLSAWGKGEGEAPIAATAGLSLGEYTALHLAGVLTFEDALELVALRGRAMQDAAEASPGGMVALIGAEEVQAQEVCDAARGGEVLVCANFNAPGQIVLSGHETACQRAATEAGKRGLRATMLQVAGAFHSPLMQPAADRLRAALEGVSMRPARATVVSNVTAEPYAAGPRGWAAGVVDLLVHQLTSPVRWAQSCAWMVRHRPGELHELAPGSTLAGLMRRIDRSAKVVTHDGP